jgi:hypothetical protein
MSNTTILVDSRTRKLLAEIGRKNQTYDEIIRELIKLRVSQGSNHLADVEL